MKILMLLFAFAVGTALSVVCYFISKWILKKHTEKYSFVSALRMIIGVAYLAVLFLIFQKSDYLFFLLIGGALGITVPALLLMVKLLKISNTITDEKRDDNGR